MHTINTNTYEEIIEKAFVIAFKQDGIFTNNAIDSMNTIDTIKSIQADINMLNMNTGEHVNIGDIETCTHGLLERKFRYYKTGWEYESSKYLYKYNEWKEKLVFKYVAILPNETSFVDVAPKLKALCEIWGLRISGTKPELWQRIRNEYVRRLLDSNT